MSNKLLLLDEINPIIFGGNAITGWAWGGADEGESLAALKTAFEKGINCVDTAPLYGMGYGEELVGKALRGVDRHQVFIATKFGARWDGHDGPVHMETKDLNGHPITITKDTSYANIMRECEASLRRLGSDYIDLYQYHHPDPSTPFEETARALNALKDAGKVRYIGVTNFSLEQVSEFSRFIKIDSIQCRYSPITLDIVENGLMKWANENSCAVLVYLALERGLLAGKIGLDTRFPEGDHRNFMPLLQEDRRKIILKSIEKLRPHAEELGCSVASLVLKWVISQEGIAGTLVGIRSSEQAIQNHDANAVAITSSIMGKMDDIFSQCRQELQG